MGLHELHASFETVEQVHDPLIETQKSRPLYSYGPIAVILFGVAIVTPAWIGLLVWLGLRLVGWILG